MDLKTLLRSKTFWTGIGGVVTSAGAYATGDITAYAAIMGALGSLAAIFIRDAVTTATKVNG